MPCPKLHSSLAIGFQKGVLAGKEITLPVELFRKKGGVLRRMCEGLYKNIFKESTDVSLGKYRFLIES